MAFREGGQAGTGMSAAPVRTTEMGMGAGSAGAAAAWPAGQGRAEGGQANPGSHVAPVCVLLNQPSKTYLSARDIKWFLEIEANSS